MKDVIKKVPIPLCGVMLGAAALGNLLQSYSEGIRYVCGIFAAFLLILVLINVILFGFRRCRNGIFVYICTNKQR